MGPPSYMRSVVDRNVVMRRMRIACWIPKATDTHSEYVILIALPLQQWLLEQAVIIESEVK